MEHDKMEKEDHLVISIKLKKFWLERLFYFAIIIGLTISLFVNPLGAAECKQTSEPITAAATTVAQEEARATPEPIPEAVPEPAPETKPEAKVASKPLSGNVTLTIGDVETSKTDADRLKVDSIFLTIDNQKKLFTPIARVYWYTASTDANIKDVPRGTYEFPSLIPTRIVTSKKLDDELTSHYVVGYESKDNKLYIIVELLDASDNSLITTERKTIGI